MLGDEPKTVEEQQRPAITWFEWLLLVVFGFILIAFRYHAFDVPLEADEANYAYIGARLLAGDQLYVDVWDHQPFGIFTMFAGVIAVFGDGPSVFRWTATAFSLVSLFLIFRIVRQIGGTFAALSAGLLFAVVSSDPGTAGEGCNREIYMNTLTLAAWWVLLARGSLDNRGLVVAGLLLGIGSTIKTILAVHWIMLAIWIVIDALRGPRRASGKRIIAQLFWFGIGPAFVWTAAVAYFAMTARLGEFFDAVFLFNLSYSGTEGSFLDRFDLIRFTVPPRHPNVFVGALPLWLAFIPSVLWMVVSGVRRRATGLLSILAMVIAGYLSVCLPAHFWPHYYYLLVPAAVMAVSLAVGRLVRGVSVRFGQRAPSTVWISAGAGLLVPLLVLLWQYEHYLAQPAFGITVSRYSSRDFWAKAHGEKIRQVTEPDDRIFAFCNDASIYYYARRRCASRFTMITGIQSGYAGSQERRRLLMQDLETNLPRVIVATLDEPPFPEWQQFLDRYYGVAVGVDRHDRTQDPIMWVFVRKDQPIQAINWNWDRSEVGGWIQGVRPP